MSSLVTRFTPSVFSSSAAPAQAPNAHAPIELDTLGAASSSCVEAGPATAVALAHPRGVARFLNSHTLAKPFVAARNLGMRAVGVPAESVPAAQEGEHAVGFGSKRFAAAASAGAILGGMGAYAVGMMAGIENCIKAPTTFNPAGTLNLNVCIPVLVLTTGVPAITLGGVVVGAGAGVLLGSVLCCCYAG